MDSEKEKSSEQNKKPSETGQQHQFTYQTNRIPWWITLMWLIFAAWAVFYLSVFAVKDFFRWW